MNGGVGILGGVADRLGIAMTVELYGAEVRGGSSVFVFLDGLRPFRPFFGGTGGEESADSISIMAGGEVGMVGMFVPRVTIGGMKVV